MNLDNAQKDQVKQWIEEGLKLSEIQDRISKRFGVSLTYMEARFLMDDLRLKPKDEERPAPMPQPDLAPPQGSVPAAGNIPEVPSASPAPLGEPGDVTVTVDQITRPGSVVSGKVTFSDGKTGDWYLDQMGRLGVVPPEPGYKPSQADLMMFQGELQNALGKLGY